MNSTNRRTIYFDVPIRQYISLGIVTSWIHLATHIDTWRARFLLWCFGAVGCQGLNVSGKMRVMNRGKLSVGKNVRINSGPDRNFVGGNRRTSFWVGKNAELILEDGVALSNSTIMVRERVRIRNNCFIGGGCDIYDTDFHELNPQDRESRIGNIASAPVEIGPSAFIGAHTLILKGVTIGEGAVIGAGSVVTKNVPPLEIWAGRPARFLRKLDQH